ncbi:Sec-independent protein translocase protein TatB [Benzoatithermus flavus]|uniref:Sec-independent protein translocase protein TatB n=1 Tax=Benzoatithermus flavus TaxID=3108223 RepID=A0ABU8XVK2_9PROT
MFLDIGWSEMALILMVALIVIGPKDLPRVARQIGRWTAKARSMAHEFQRSLDDMAREAELQDLKAEMEKLSRTDVRHEIEKTIDPEGELRKSLAAPIDLDGKPAAPPEASLANPATPEAVPNPPPPALAEPAAPHAPAAPVPPAPSSEPTPSTVPAGEKR